MGRRRAAVRRAARARRGARASTRCSTSALRCTTRRRRAAHGGAAGCVGALAAANVSSVALRELAIDDLSLEPRAPRRPASPAPRSCSPTRRLSSARAARTRRAHARVRVDGGARGRPPPRSPHARGRRGGAPRARRRRSRRPGALVGGTQRGGRGGRPSSAVTPSGPPGWARRALAAVAAAHRAVDAGGATLPGGATLALAALELDGLDTVRELAPLAPRAGDPCGLSARRARRRRAVPPRRGGVRAVPRPAGRPRGRAAAGVYAALDVGLRPRSSSLRRRDHAPVSSSSRTSWARDRGSALGGRGRRSRSASLRPRRCRTRSRPSTRSRSTASRSPPLRSTSRSRSTTRSWPRAAPTARRPAPAAALGRSSARPRAQRRRRRQRCRCWPRDRADGRQLCARDRCRARPPRAPPRPAAMRAAAAARTAPALAGRLAAVRRRVLAHGHLPALRRMPARSRSSRATGAARGAAPGRPAREGVCLNAAPGA